VSGLRAAKDMAINKLAIFGDSESVFNQLKDIYQTKQLRPKQYMNEVWDIVDNLCLAFNISFVPRDANQREDSLALAASTFKTLIGPNI
jgi:ribonuclease HI